MDVIQAHNEFTWSKQVLDSLFSQAGIKVGASLSASLVALLFGDNILLLFVLILLLGLDFVTGASKAIKLDTFSTAGLRRGGVKIATYLVLMIVAHVFTYVHEYLQWFDDAVYCYIALTEYESIAENLLVFNIKWPSIGQLRRFVAQIKEDMK